MHFRHLAAVFSLVITGISRAEAPVSIESIVTEALTRNPEVAWCEAQLAQARGQRIDAGKLPNPEASAQLARWSVAGAGDGPAWQATVSQTFEWAGRLALRKAIADRDIEVAQLGLDSFRHSLAAAVRSAAWEHLIAREKSAAGEEAVQRVQAVLDVLVQRDPTGPAPLLETRILEATLLSLRRQAGIARQALSGAGIRLNQLRGARPAAELVLKVPDMSLPALPRDAELYTAAFRSNFTLRMKEAELRRQGFAVQLAVNEGSPSVSVQPFVSSQKAGQDRETTAGIALSIPLPLWNRNEGNVAAAEARQAQAQAALKMAVREVEKDIAEKAAVFRLLTTEMQQWRADSLERFREAAEQADRHYQAGAIPVSTYIELQKSWLEAQDALLSTRAEAVASMQELEVLTGLRLLPSTAAKSDTAR